MVSILLAVPEREQSLGEEIANSISHGIGLVAALIATPFLIMRAVQYADTGFIIGASFFAATMILLYLASTLYHALPQGKAKRVFKIIEHSAIYLLIAGTYTPFTLGVLRGPWGWTLFGIVWGLAAIGVTLKAFDKMHNPIITTSLYLLMGWLILIAIYPLYTRIPVSGLLWLIAGGVTYTIGVFFFATDSRFRYGHFIWHLFVMVGTVCHYFAVLWYAAP
ncbi:hemolysin III family protein [Nitrosomonas sp. GH22]|nr:hemolysin III family protein [Nitrosomonas sp. GH22]